MVFGKAKLSFAMVSIIITWIFTALKREPQHLLETLSKLLYYFTNILVQYMGNSKQRQAGSGRELIVHYVLLHLYREVPKHV